jgi:hypothetical protein
MAKFPSMEVMVVVQSMCLTVLSAKWRLLWCILCETFRAKCKSL